MRSWMLIAYLALMLVFSAGEEPRAETPCPTLGSQCDCSWHVRNCLPTCHIQPRLVCAPT
jgi:hypothetical protein